MVFPLYAAASGNEYVELPVDPPHATLERLAILEDGEAMREALLLDVLGEIRHMYPHHQLSVSLVPMDLVGQPVVQQRTLPLRQATVVIVERP